MVEQPKATTEIPDNPDNVKNAKDFKSALGEALKNGSITKEEARALLERMTGEKKERIRYTRGQVENLKKSLNIKGNEKWVNKADIKKKLEEIAGKPEEKSETITEKIGENDKKELLASINKIKGLEKATIDSLKIKISQDGTKFDLPDGLVFSNKNDDDWSVEIKEGYEVKDGRPVIKSVENKTIEPTDAQKNAEKKEKEFKDKLNDSFKLADKLLKTEVKRNDDKTSEYDKIEQALEKANAELLKAYDNLSTEQKNEIGKNLNELYEKLNKKTLREQTGNKIIDTQGAAEIIKEIKKQEINPLLEKARKLTSGGGEFLVNNLINENDSKFLNNLNSEASEILAIQNKNEQIKKIFKIAEQVTIDNEKMKIEDKIKNLENVKFGGDTILNKFLGDKIFKSDFITSLRSETSKLDKLEKTGKTYKELENLTVLVKEVNEKTSSLNEDKIKEVKELFNKITVSSIDSTIKEIKKITGSEPIKQ